MKTVKLSVRPVLSDIFMRQTPGNRGIWGDCIFYINTEVEQCDWWVVCHNTGLAEIETTLCDPDHLVFVSLEPYDSWLSMDFINQFSKVVLCDRAIRHPDITFRNGLNWWVGINVQFRDGHRFTPEYTLDYDGLSSMSPVNKDKFMSIICSNKSYTDGHRKRLRFLEKLRAHPLAAYIDFFGGDTNPIDDKWDGIVPYKYHIALENDTARDYWSEKLADSFLGFSYPLYYGCQNIHDYFSREAVSVIDIEKFDQTVSLVEKLLSSPVHYSDSLPAVLKARDQVLNEYNIFQLISDICDKPAEKTIQCKLNPHALYKPSWKKPSFLGRAVSKARRTVNMLAGKRSD